MQHILFFKKTLHTHQLSHYAHLMWWKTNFIVICFVKTKTFHCVMDSGGEWTLTGHSDFGHVGCWFWHYHSSCRRLAGPTLLLGSGEVSSRILHQGNIKQYLPTVTRAVYWIRGAWDSKFCAFNSILSFNRQTSSSDKLTHGTEWYYASIYTHTHIHPWICRRNTHNMLSFQLIYW